MSGVSKSSTASSSHSETGVFPSVGSPPSHHQQNCVIPTAAHYPKGWCSERVRPPVNWRHQSNNVMLPFSNNRKLPSKWDDAERWILSPVSSETAGRLFDPHGHDRRPKSKSGPLGHPSGSFSSASPFVPCFNGVVAGNFMARSQFAAGVLMVDERKHDCLNGDDKESCIVRSASMHGCSDALMEQSLSEHDSAETTDDLGDGAQVETDAASAVSSAFRAKDASTQMSSEGSTPSSPNKSCSKVSSQETVEKPGSQLMRPEIRDVQVDDQVTPAKCLKQHTEGFDKQLASIMEGKKKPLEVKEPSFNETGHEQCISRCKREEAKITAWENLQKAKAEAAIRKLEMRLEKKRSSSMDKILNKLRDAQKRAHDLRMAASSDAEQCTVTIKRASMLARSSKIGFFNRCFRWRSC